MSLMHSFQHKDHRNALRYLLWHTVVQKYIFALIAIIQIIHFYGTLNALNFLTLNFSHIYAFNMSYLTQ